jgi:DNA repair protein RecN (Recombination protein N)
MLKELQVKNFAVIDDITVKFGKGLNILSGETGAGKTLVIEAINLLLGERADNDLIRENEDKLFVQGYFDLSGSKKSIQFLKGENLIGDEEGFADTVITREVNRQGKNRAFINGIFTQVSTLKNLGKCFLDLHGQHDHQYLLESETHIDIIDSFGQNEIKDPKSDFIKNYNNFISISRELARLLKQQDEKEMRLSELQFRLSEIEKLELKDDEETELENEKNVLKNYEKIFNICSRTIGILNGADNHPEPLIDDLSILEKNIVELSSIDKSFERFLKEICSLTPVVDEIDKFIKSYIDNLHFSADRLDKIQERLFAISEIKRKYRMEIGEIRNFAGEIKKEIEGYESLDFEIEKTQKEFRSKELDLVESAMTLSKIRKNVISTFSEAVRYELSDLAFKVIEFEVKDDYIPSDNGASAIELDGKRVKVSSKGIDNIEFLLSLNPGESVKPLRKIVSGGEISRIMLALKSLVGGIDNIISMVFDEIDTGIGGETAIVVGKKLHFLSKKCQVICITHLPQIAAFADNHYFIDKIISKERTKIKISKLSGNKKIEELSRMLSGMTGSDISIKHAVELIEETNRIKDENLDRKINIEN